MHDAEEFPAAPDVPATRPVPPIPTQRSSSSVPPGSAQHPVPPRPPGPPPGWQGSAQPGLPPGWYVSGPPAPRAPLADELPSTHPLAPAPIEVSDLPPLVLMPGTAPLPPSRRRVRGLLVGGGFVLAAVLAVGAGVVYTNRAPLSLAEQAVAAAPEATTKQAPRTPAEEANETLKAQAAALLAGDEKAWLAAVDPGQSRLRSRYRAMFSSLRSLGVSHYVYRASVDPPDKKSGQVGVTAEVEYCFTTDKCPQEKDNVSDGPPTITQSLTFKQVKGKLLITALATEQSRDRQQPAPWETGSLVFLTGNRVTVAGAGTERKYFKQVLAAAERAAAVNDRFAEIVGNPQRRYRVYVAGPKQWKTWYGGITDKWVIGYAMPLSDSGSDVVLNISAVRGDSQVLVTTLQHELGHVVTLGGAYRTNGSGDMWLEEGIAEYIGWYPRSATASWRRDAVRTLLRSSKRPKSIAARAPADNASPQASDAFYGLGHFTAECLARKYGQSALFTFVRLYLRENRDLDPASQEAFGTPFPAVDKTCMAWIRDRV